MNTFSIAKAPHSSNICAARSPEDSYGWPDEDLYWDTVLMQLSLHSQPGHLIGFSLKLRAELTPAAKKAKKTYSAWVNETFSRRLRPLERRIDRKLPYWFAVEAASAGVRVHGSIAVEYEYFDELQSILEGLNQGGENPFEIIEEFRFCGIQGAFAWVNYCIKDVLWTQGYISGSPIVCRRELKEAFWEARSALRADHKLRQLEHVLRSNVYDMIGDVAETEIIRAVEVPDAEVSAAEKPNVETYLPLKASPDLVDEGGELRATRRWAAFAKLNAWVPRWGDRGKIQFN
jgi:hypothetical protein